jgi:hypothetical protein
MYISTTASLEPLAHLVFTKTTFIALIIIHMLHRVCSVVYLEISAIIGSFFSRRNVPILWHTWEENQEQWSGCVDVFLAVSWAFLNMITFLFAKYQDKLCTQVWWVYLVVSVLSDIYMFDVDFLINRSRKEQRYAK